jgi:hypothetical protein
VLPAGWLAGWLLAAGCRLPALSPLLLRLAAGCWLLAARCSLLAGLLLLPLPPTGYWLGWLLLAGLAAAGAGAAPCRHSNSLCTALTVGYAWLCVAMRAVPGAIYLGQDLKLKAPVFVGERVAAVRERNAFFAPFSHARDVFVKTGSGQSEGNSILNVFCHRPLLSWSCRLCAEEPVCASRLTHPALPCLSCLRLCVQDGG